MRRAIVLSSRPWTDVPVDSGGVVPLGASGKSARSRCMTSVGDAAGFSAIRARTSRSRALRSCAFKFQEKPSIRAATRASSPSAWQARAMK